MKRLKQLLDDRDRAFYILRGFLPLGFISGEGIVAEGLSMVESHADISRFLFGDNLIKGIDKAHNGRCVQSFGVDSWVFDKRII